MSTLPKINYFELLFIDLYTYTFIPTNKTPGLGISHAINSIKNK